MSSASIKPPTSAFSFNLPKSSSARKEIRNEEKDDFEAMFLSDIALPSKATSSVITNFQDKTTAAAALSEHAKASRLPAVDLRLKPVLPSQHVSQHVCKPSGEDSLKSLNKFVESLKEVPLLDMDRNLRKIINEKYSDLKKENAARFTDTFFILNMFYTRNSYDQRYKFDVKSHLRHCVQSSYANWLENCPEELLTCLEHGSLG